MPRRASILAVLLAGAALPARAQEDLRSSVEAVRLSVVVTDGGRFIDNLTRGDFVVLEDGAPQQLTLFRETVTPVSVVFLIDASLSMQEKLPAVQAAVGRFVDQLRPGDDAKVVQFSDRVRTLQEFSQDRAALKAALLEVRTGGDTRLLNAIYAALKDLARPQRGRDARRKALVFFSDGDDTASLLTGDEVVDAARKGDVTIYAVNLAAPSAFSDDDDRGRGELFASLARETGGTVFTPELGGVDKAYRRIAAELGKQYVLGYVSANPRQEGKWRRIHVGIAGRKGLAVRHKLGYYEKRG